MTSSRIITKRDRLLGVQYIYLPTEMLLYPLFNWVQDLRARFAPSVSVNAATTRWWHRWYCAHYRPRSEASEGYVFTGVCHFNSEGEGEEEWTRDQVTTPPFPLQDQVTTPPPLPPPPPRDQVTTPPSPLLGPGHNTSPPPPPSWDQVTTPPPPGAMRRRAVRILLECILSTRWEKMESL